MPLENLERRQFAGAIRKAILDRLGQGQGYTGGPTAGQFGVMSGTQPTAAESTAFNQGVRNRALHGDRWNRDGGIGRPGILREEIRAKALSDIAGRGMTAKERADIELKKGEQEQRERGKWNWKPDSYGDEAVASGPPAKVTNMPYTEGTRENVTPLNKPLGGGQFPAPAGSAPAVRDAVPAARRSGGGGITVPPLREGEDRDPRIAPPGTYSAPGEYDPGLGARIREQIEGGGQAGENLADYAPPPGGQHPETRMALPVDYEAENYKPPLREVAQTARKPEVSVAEIAKALKAASARPGKTRASSAESTKEKGLAWLSKLIEGLWPKGQPHDLLYRQVRLP